jgi:hypothetical protein
MNPARRPLAVVAILSLVIQSASLLALQPPAQDPGWPRQFVKNGDTLVYYQSQIDSWNSYKDLKGRTAFTLTPHNSKTTAGEAEFRERAPHAQQNIHNAQDACATRQAEAGNRLGATQSISP